MKKLYFRFIAISLGITISFAIFAQTDKQLSTKALSADEIQAVLQQVQPGDVNSGNSYKSAMATCTNVLSTPVLGGNGYDGNMFDVTASSDVTIETFAVTIDSTVNCAIFVKTGTFVGSQTTPGDWTFLDSAIVVGAGIGVPVEIPVDVSYSMLSGSTHAFYVTATAPDAMFNYTNGTAVGNTLASDANLLIKEGDGGEYPFNVTNSPRTFNGDIIYCLPSGVTETLSSENVSIYPNPATDDLNISLPSLYGVSTRVLIYNVIGEVIFEEKIIADGTTHSLDISKLNSGVYFVRLQAEDFVYSTNLFVD